MGEENTFLQGASGENQENKAAESGGEFNYREHLSEEYKDKYPELQDLNSVFKSYHNLVGKMGQNPIVKPSDDATDEAKAEYTSLLRKELGAPENKDAYEIKLSEDLPEGFVNDDVMDGMKDVFLKHGIAPDAAQEIIGTYFEKQLASYNETQQAEEGKFNDSIEQLKKDWKGEYDSNLNKASAFAEKHFSKETIDKYGNDPEFIKETLSLYNKISAGDRISDLAGEVKQTPADLRIEARKLMSSEEYRNIMSPSHNTIVARAKDLYQRASAMEA